MERAVSNRGESPFMGWGGIGGPEGRSVYEERGILVLDGSIPMTRIAGLGI